MSTMTALPKNIRQIGDIRGQEKIYLEDYVMTYIRKKEETQEYLGLFLGERQEVESQDCIFIRGILEVPKQEEGQETEAWKDQIASACQNYFAGWQVIGCCVIGTYQTERMESLCSIIPESADILYHLQEQEETLYAKTEGQYRRIKGYFVFYEQNRLMQEYMAEVFREKTVEKETVPDRAMKRFREKVKEKSLQKSNGMLKLASSFFVVTMLVLGAVAVNHVEELREGKKQGEDFLQESEEQQRLVNGALMQERSGEGAGVQNQGTDGSGSKGAGTQKQETDGSGSKGAGTQNQEMDGSSSKGADSEIGGNEMMQNVQLDAGAKEQAVSWYAGGALAGPDSFWDGADDMQVSASVQEPSGEPMQNQAEEASADVLQSQAEESPADVLQSQAEESLADALQSQAEESSADAQPVSAMRQTQASYIIRPGDTLADICERYYGSLGQLAALCEANEITDANVIMPGQKIVLP